MFKRNIIFVALIITGLFFSCVPARQYQDLKTKNQKCEEEREYIKNKNAENEVKVAELESKFEELSKQVKMLMNDTTVTGITLRKLTQQYDKINELNDELLKKLRQKNMDESSETRKLLAELQEMQENLQKQKDEIKDMENVLDAKKKDLELLQTQMSDKDKMLEEKNRKLIELQTMLSRKDSIVNALKDKVSAALKGFEGEGLTIEERNGKVYVSLDEKLLFKSGKWDVDPNGQKALIKLADVLEKNDDINIMIEGHTDDLAYGGSGNISDNWDLSVKRATAIVKILLKDSKIDPKRLIASGRGEFLPVDPAKTTEARTKNRRTEIILTPKLDELFQILETN
ncbi:MAG: OmpA family protein [Bacteroidota bacterium]